MEKKLELRLDKCEFFKSVVKYLGYKISGEGIRADDKGLQGVRDFPIPQKVHEVESFLGLCSYFRRFVKNFSTIAKPLYDLTKRDKKFEFGEEQLKSFETLKSKLLADPVLALYSQNDPSELHCDASSLGFGAILMQKKRDGKLHPIFYFSKITTDTESRYHSFELDTLAIIYALQRFRIYEYTNTFEENLIICQAQDKRLKSIKALLEKSEHKHYEMRNGVVYRKKSDKSIAFCVPEDLHLSITTRWDT